MSSGWMGVAIAIGTMTTGSDVAGQNFQRRYDAWGLLLAETGFGIEHWDNGYVVVAGSEYVQDSLIYSSVVTFLVLDSAGNAQDTLEAFLPWKATYPGFCGVSFEFQGGGVGVAGSSDDTLDTHRPVLYLLDGVGALPQVFEYGVSGETWIGYQGKPALDYGFVIAGITSSSGTSLDAFLLRIDSAFNQEWVQTYGLPNRQEYALTVDLAPNGGYYIGGTRAIVPGSYDHWVLLVDSAGNEVWSNTYGTPYDDPYAAHLESMQNGDAVFCTGWAQDDFGIQRLGMARIDPTGAVVWSRSYDSLGFASSFFAVKELQPSGDLITAGQTYVPGYLQGVLLRTNANGDSLWLRNYHYYDSLWTEGKGRFLDVIQTVDNGFIAVGAAYDSNNPADYDSVIYNQDTWVVKVDSMGCLVPGCDGISTITTQITNYRDALMVAPNPASTSAQLRWQLPQALTSKGGGVLSVVDAQSRVVRTEALDLASGTHELEVSALAPGLYHLHMVQNGTWVTGCKLVVQ